MVVVVKDITQQKRAEAEREEVLRREQQLRHAAEASSRAKSEFLSVISHELRTPLSSASAFAEVLESEESGPLTDPQREQLQQVQASIWQLNDLVGEILDYTRVERGQLTVKPQEVDGVTLARDVVRQMEPLATARRLRLDAVSPLERVPLVTDAGRAKQILLNLVSNAVKFTDSGEIRVLVTAADERVRFAVSDTGVGIAPEHQGRVFDPFWQVESPLTRRSGGTGLGLAIARSLAELLDGSIELVSRPGRGSTFTLILPRHLRPRARAVDAGA